MSRTIARNLIGAGLIAILSAPGALAGDDKDHKGRGKHHDNTADQRAVADTAVRRDAFVIDRDGHRRIVTEYVDREGLPPGLARRRSLPPGLARQLRERGQLPPGLQRRLIVVPRPLVDRLPPQPSYYTRYFAGRDMIVVDRRTNRVAAIIPNVLPR